MDRHPFPLRSARDARSLLAACRNDLPRALSSLLTHRPPSPQGGTGGVSPAEAAARTRTNLACLLCWMCGLLPDDSSGASGAGATLAETLDALYSAICPAGGAGDALCGHVFTDGELTYHCIECAADSTCVFCARCFNASDHTGHTVKYARSGGGGVCDCGDPEAWAPAGWPKWAQDAAAAAAKRNPRLGVPDDVLAVLETFLPACVEALAGFTHAVRRSFLAPHRHEMDFAPGDRIVVGLHNDDVHTYEQVIAMVRQVRRCDRQAAFALTTQVDKLGALPVFEGTYGEAVALGVINNGPSETLPTKEDMAKWAKKKKNRNKPCVAPAGGQRPTPLMKSGLLYSVRSETLHAMSSNVEQLVAFLDDLCAKSAACRCIVAECTSNALWCLRLRDGLTPVGGGSSEKAGSANANATAGVSKVAENTAEPWRRLTLRVDPAAAAAAAATAAAATAAGGKTSAGSSSPGSRKRKAGSLEQQRQQQQQQQPQQQQGDAAASSYASKMDLDQEDEADPADGGKYSGDTADSPADVVLSATTGTSASSRLNEMAIAAESISAVSFGESRLARAPASQAQRVSALMLLLANDVYLPKPVVLALHNLFTHMLQDKLFKAHFGHVYIAQYPWRCWNYSMGSGTEEESVQSISVQIMTTPSLVLEMMDSHALLSQLMAGVQHTLCVAAALRFDDSTVGHSFEKAALARLAKGQSPVSQIMGHATKVDFKAHTLGHKRYAHIVYDLKYALRVGKGNEGARRFVTDSPAYLAAWIAILAFWSGRAPFRRKSGSHVAYEDQDWVHPFNLFMFTKRISSLLGCAVADADRESLQKSSDPAISAAAAAAKLEDDVDARARATLDPRVLERAARMHEGYKRIGDALWQSGAKEHAHEVPDAPPLALHEMIYWMKAALPGCDSRELLLNASVKKLSSSLSSSSSSPSSSSLSSSSTTVAPCIHGRTAIL